MEQTQRKILCKESLEGTYSKDQMKQSEKVAEVVALEHTAYGRCPPLMLEDQAPVKMNAILEEGGKESNE